MISSSVDVARIRAKTLALLLALSMEVSRSVALKPTAVSIVFYREFM